MSVSFYNPYIIKVEPLKIYNKIKEINTGLGLNLKYDPEANKVSLWGIMPANAGYIEIIMPYDFDPLFFLPQFIELRCTINGSIRKEFIAAINYSEIIENMKKLIVVKLIENNIYGFDNLQLIKENYDIGKNFIFFKNNIKFQGIIYFMDGNVNILIIHS
jgi:hypothetical protein